MAALGAWDSHDNRTTAQKLFGTGTKPTSTGAVGAIAGALAGGGGGSIVTAPKKATTPAKTYTSTKKTTAPAASGGAPAPSYDDGYSAAAAAARAEAESKKINDAPLVAALQAMLDTGFASARDTKLANIELTLSGQDKIMLDDYLKRASGLEGSRADNEKAEADSTFANFANRARERGDILNQATAMGAGESDTLRSALMALRNWSANQGDVNRSYYDTLRSVNSAITDLNTDTRSARTNLYTAANSDRESIWTNYYNQRSDAFTQLGNIKSNPNSDSYAKDADVFARAAESAGEAWKSPGVPSAVADWQGTTLAEERALNNTDAAAMVTNIGVARKPEGATLRKW